MSWTSRVMIMVTGCAFAAESAAQPVPVPTPGPSSNPWASEPPPLPPPPPVPTSAPVPVPVPAPVPASVSGPSATISPSPRETTRPNPEAATEDVDTDTDTVVELPWYLPAIQATSSAELYKPFSVSGAVAVNSIDGGIVGDIRDLMVMFQTSRWTSLGIGMASAEVVVTDDEQMFPVPFVGRLGVARLDIGRDIGREVYAKDKVRVFVLLPSGSVSVATNASDEASLSLASARFRLVGLRLQICPGIHVDLSGPVFSRWAGSVSAPMGLSADAPNHAATGSSIGIEFEVGYTWWKGPGA